jgi:riboflavin kinase/FMN adenylyltransferase
MRVLKRLPNNGMESGSVITVGSFDGVHLGHKAIFDKLIDSASRDGLRSVVVTFDPHPRKVLGGASQNLKLLTTLDEKIALFEKMGINRLQIIHFTQEFSRLSYIEFVENILVGKLSVREMVIGHDHHFGRDREGGWDKLIELGNKHGFSVKQVDPLTTNGKIISSSVIRRFLEEGEIENANEFLGRGYSIRGRVVKGDGRGREIGYPTANILPDDADKVVPKRGVYAVDVFYENNVLKGMMNIGYRPTFNFDPLTLEVHIFNFNAYIYENSLDIRFKKYIRDERKFDNIDELIAQLNEDKIKSENV